jgi:putative thioredoxin
MERAKGFEPSTPTLARSCSTPELRPLWRLTALAWKQRAGVRRAVSIGAGSGQGQNRAKRQELRSFCAMQPSRRFCPSQMLSKAQSRQLAVSPADGVVSLASMGLNIEEQKAVDRFRTNVVEPSMTSLVILDFWAEWCGPCKALTPLLEKVAADYADKGVVLAKVNVDEEGFIASQFQVKSIPTVYAMFQGQPVADLTNARSESQLKGMLDQLLAKLPVSGDAGGSAEADIAPMLAMGDDVLASGDGERAAGIFVQIAEMAPDNALAHAGLIRALALAGRTFEADAALAALDPEMAKDPAIVRAAAALELAKAKPEEGELAGLRAAAAAAPADMDAQLAYATAAFAAGERDAAADTLLVMVAADREWNEGAARAKLLQMFEAIGLEDPWVAATRRRLSTVLFG